MSAEKGSLLDVTERAQKDWKLVHLLGITTDDHLHQHCSRVRLSQQCHTEHWSASSKNSSGWSTPWKPAPCTEDKNSFKLNSLETCTEDKIRSTAVRKGSSPDEEFDACASTNFVFVFDGLKSKPFDCEVRCSRGQKCFG